MDGIDGLIEKARQRMNIDDRFSAVQVDEDLPFEVVCNRSAVRVARRFEADEMPYWEADDAMNMLWTAMTNHALRHPGEIAEPAFSIYEAFDAGEYHHGDGSDPVETFTRPALHEILTTMDGVDD